MRSTNNEVARQAIVPLPYLTTAEAAAYLRWSTRTIREKLRAGAFIRGTHYYLSYAGAGNRSRDGWKARALGSSRCRAIFAGRIARGDESRAYPCIRHRIHAMMRQECDKNVTSICGSDRSYDDIPPTTCSSGGTESRTNRHRSCLPKRRLRIDQIGMPEKVS
jgi:hypothetical protein